MKLILSRKGFDASTGGVASPILPSGRLCSFPIPSKGARNIRYGDMSAGDINVGALVEALTAGAITASDAAHLDPDLDRHTLPRSDDWRPLFGQAGAAQGHLRNQRVSPGDIFLFFGWFRHVERSNGTYRFVPDAPDLHVLFGWLQVSRKIRVGAEPAPEWAQYHPHIQNADRPSNTLYIARNRLSLPTNHKEIPGAGVFPRYTTSLRLTALGASRSVWRLPAWFHPHGKSSHLTYHHRSDRWQHNGDHVLLQTSPRGQEFVLDCEEYPEAIEWMATLCAAVQ